MNIASILVSKYHFPIVIIILKKELLGEMADARPGAGKIPNEPESCARKQGRAQRMMGMCQKDPGAVWMGSHWSNMRWSEYQLNNGAQSLSHIWLFATWTVAHQAPLSMGFPRQEYWSELPFPPAEDLPEPVIKLGLLPLLHWQANSLPLSHLGS